MAGAALFIRLATIAFFRTYEIPPDQDHYSFAWEAGRVARAIALGEGFSNPYQVHTGPTALLPPVFPYLLALIFKVFGIYSTASAVAILTINSVFSALVCVVVYRIAQESFGFKVAILAGWLWALYPYSIYCTARSIWETNLSVLLMSTLFWMTLRLEQGRSTRAWLGYGVLWGVTALTNPAILSVLPFLAAWLIVRHRKRGSGCVRQLAACAALIMVFVIPWTVRNFLTFGQVIPMRSGLGLELHVGNHATDETLYAVDLLPLNNAKELARFAQAGEIAYMAEKRQEALEWIAENPGRFVWLSCRKALYLWTHAWSIPQTKGYSLAVGLMGIAVISSISLLALHGLAAAFRECGHLATPYLLVMLVYPTIYALTHPMLRFRHPIDPMVLVLVAFSLWRIWDRLRAKASGQQ